MSGTGKDEKKSTGWSDWQRKRDDWNIANNKRPKLDIHKSHLSQSMKGKAGENVSAETETGRRKSIRRTNSLPSRPQTSPSKDDCEGFIDIDAVEAKAFADAADAAENAMAGEKTSASNTGIKVSVPSTLKTLQKTPAGDALSCYKPYGNNGSSGYEMLFEEDLGVDFEMLASQEFLASQNVATDTSAYNLFAKEINVHSSVLEPNFKKPVSKAPPINQGMNKVSISNSNPSPSTKIIVGTNPKYTNSKPACEKIFPEAEVRRLSLEMESIVLENNKLKDSLRTKEGEVSLVRSQLKKAVTDSANQKTKNDQSVIATEQRYVKRLHEMEKEIQLLNSCLKFQEAETNASKQRLALLSQASPQIKVVQPPPSVTTAPPTTPQRGSSKAKYVSNFLNRSTFEETSQSTSVPSRKRLRLANDVEDREEPQLLYNVNTENNYSESVKSEMKSVESQTILKHDDLDDITWMQDPLNVSVCKRLTEKLAGLQLVSDVRLEHEFTVDGNVDIYDLETISTQSLLSLKPNFKKSRRVLNEKQRPHLLNCAENLKTLMCFNNPSSLTEIGKAALLQVFKECCGIVHYHLFLLQDLDNSVTDKQLRERDQEIIDKCPELLPLYKQFELLDDRPWHKDECGVEVRRSLGIMSEVCTVYRYGALLLAGQSCGTIPKHNFTKLPEFSNNCAVSSESSCDENQCWFLKVLCDMSSAIVKQKCTIALSGVLAGTLVLLKVCAQQKVIMEGSQSIVLSTIREVLLTRPPNTVLLLLVDLLVYCTKCEEIMKGLCINSDVDDADEDTMTGTCTFSRKTCTLQLLCIQLKRVTEPHSWRLVDVLIRWLSSVVSQGWAAPTWIISSPPASHFSCCALLLSTVVSLLWNTFETYLFVEEEGDPTLEKDDSLLISFPRIMRRAIALFHGLLVNNMLEYMGHVEGSYESLLRKLSQMSNLSLTPALQNELAALMKMEQNELDSLKANPNNVRYATSYWDCALTSLEPSQ